MFTLSCSNLEVVDKMWLSWRIINFLKEKKNGKGGRYLEKVKCCVRDGIKEEKNKE